MSQLPLPAISIGSVQLEMGDVLSRYATWQPPTVIISDGAYGLGLFPGEPLTPTELANWYAPHVAAWSRYSLRDKDESLKATSL